MARVQRLNYGTVKLAGKYNPPNFVDTRIPVFGYLIQLEALTILVDTGVGSGHPYVEKVFEPDLIDVTAALAELDLSPIDLDCVVNSHLHFDHCGANQAFRGLPHYVQAAEIEEAASDNYTIKEWISWDDLVPVAGDLELSEEVSLLSTPGHTPGHQSILIDEGESKLLIAAQAAFSLDEFVRGGDPEVQAHEGIEEKYVASLDRLKAIDADRIYLSHDVREYA